MPQLLSELYADEAAIRLVHLAKDPELRLSDHERHILIDAAVVCQAIETGDREKTG